MSCECVREPNYLAVCDECAHRIAQELVRDLKRARVGAIPQVVVPRSTLEAVREALDTAEDLFARAFGDEAGEANRPLPGGLEAAYGRFNADQYQAKALPKVRAALALLDEVLHDPKDQLG